MTVRVGVIGGGQLARMMIAPAVELGLDLRVLAEDTGMSAQLAATAVGDYRDLETVRAFAREVDVITFDHEHVPQDVLRALVADGVQVCLDDLRQLSWVRRCGHEMAYLLYKMTMRVVAIGYA